MDYALVDEGIVTNLIWLYPGNAEEFPNAVPLEGRPVQLGDAYEDGQFFREGQRVLHATEKLLALEGLVAELDAAVMGLAYENALMGLGII